MLISKYAILKWSANNKKRYVELGYKFTKMNDPFIVRVEDLSKGSSALVDCKCKHCKKKVTKEYNQYNRNISKNNGVFYCEDCARVINKKKSVTRNKITFEKWCLENNHKDFLDKWDIEANNGVLPSQVSFKSNKSFYFKCDNPNHKSELKRICDITKNKKILCNQCNSVMQYAIDNNRLKELNLKKNYELGIDLWSIPYKSKTEIWCLCDNEETPYHNDNGGYLTSCIHFSNGCSCPYCNGKRVHRKDSIGEKIIQLHGEDFLWKVWSDKNEVSPFEVLPRSMKKFLWNCPDGKHKPFLRTCDGAIVCDFRCQECFFENNTKENHPNWNPNKSQEEREKGRNYFEYNEFVKEVLKRDDYTCQITGKRGGNDLEIHHLNGFNWDKENRTNPDNGIVLCEDIHKLFHHIYGYGDNTEEQFNEFLELIENGDIDISNIN